MTNSQDQWRFQPFTDDAMSIISPILDGAAQVAEALGNILAPLFETIGPGAGGLGDAADGGLGMMMSGLAGVAAALLVVIGAILLVPVLQERLAIAAGPISSWADQTFGSQTGPGILGQFGVGLVLGAVWSPCVGPTLGAASLLAAQGKDLEQVALTLLAFGLGAAMPLLLLGTLSREILNRWRDRLTSAGSTGKYLLGGMLVVTGFAILTGLDKALEAKIVAASPAWLTELTTRF